MSNYPFEAHEDISNYRSGIYAIVNLATNKLYIGSAIKLSSRMSTHLSNLNLGKHKNRHLQRSFNKYGKDYFVFKVVEYCLPEDLIEREQFWINQFDFDTQLYNINPTAGSQLGTKRSEETKKRISAAKKGNVHSEETRQRMSESAKGKIISKETRKRMSESHLGVRKSRESVEKWAAKRRGVARPQSVVDKCKIQPSCKRVQQIDKVTKEVISTFNSINEAARCVGGYAPNISTVCLGKRKSAYQYIWAFEELK